MKCEHNLRAKLACAAIISLLAGCASAPEGAAGGADTATTVTCKNEAPLGSSISQRKCSAPMSNQDRAAMESDIQLHGARAPVATGNR